MNDKLAVAIISKGIGEEIKRLDRALSSVRPYVDGIFVTLTSPKEQLAEVEAICKKHKVTVSYANPRWIATKEAVEWLTKFFGYEPHMKAGDALFCFDDARNFNFSQVPEDYHWIMWMDTDDVLLWGEKLRGVIDLANKNNIEAVFFNYIYQAEFNPKGEMTAIVIEHLRERIVRNGLFNWVMPIHETLIEKRPTRKTDNRDSEVLHLATHEDRMGSLQRNLKNLELAIYKTEGKDPRQVYYLAKAYFDLATQDGKKEYFDKAIPLIKTYLIGPNPSGWPEERAQACEYLAEIYRIKDDYDKSVWAGMNALIEEPENPSVFLNLAATATMRQQWERALFWVKIASSIKQKGTTLVVNPRDIQIRTLEIIYNCCVQLGRVDEAWAAMKKLVEMYPREQKFMSALQFIDGIKAQRETIKHILSLADILKQTNERAKIRPLLAAIPRFVENTPFIADLMKQNLPSKMWGEDEIAIFCGPGFTTWSPKRLQDPKEAFVGGSEEAVIHMSRELQKLGWKVTVYADPGEDEGEYDGVQWLPYYRFNRSDVFNIVIAWRNVAFVDEKITANKVYIWNHDIQNPLDWTKERTDKITKAIFLSQWHRENVKTLPDEKVLLSSNGI